ncbi:MAG: hypothetical protein O7E51_11615 [Acidobacteria bacterium]|nr:hypothetical protein [Acidobacteriota bacterium]
MRLFLAVPLSLAMILALYQAPLLHRHDRHDGGPSGHAKPDRRHSHADAPFVHSHGIASPARVPLQGGSGPSISEAEHNGKSLDVFRLIAQNNPVQNFVLTQNIAVAAEAYSGYAHREPPTRTHDPPVLGLFRPRAPPL